MRTDTIIATDGIPLTFDVVGEGPTLILLHGGGQTRQRWHETGYIERLATFFKVIALDIRGEVGASGKPTDPSFYTIDRMCADILEVADACGDEEFILWGFSYGGNIGRFLAAKSERIKKFVMVGINFGSAAEGRFKRYIEEFIEHWSPILEAQRNGTLDLESLSAEDQEDLAVEDMNVPLAWLTAMLSWGSNRPSDMKCPTLWIFGTENQNCTNSLVEYGKSLEDSLVQVETLEGITHREEFTEIEVVFPIIFEFINAIIV